MERVLPPCSLWRSGDAKKQSEVKLKWRDQTPKRRRDEQEMNKRNEEECELDLAISDRPEEARESISCSHRRPWRFDSFSQTAAHRTERISRNFALRQH